MDLDITKRFIQEEQERKEKEWEPEDIALEGAEDTGTGSKSEGRNVLIMTAVLIGMFALFFGGSYYYNNHITGAAVVTLDDLHTENFQGNLNEEEGYVYNGYSFVKNDGIWWTKVETGGGILSLPLHFGPREVEDIVVEGTLNPLFNEGEDVYVAIDPLVRDKYYTLAVSELSFNIVQGFNRKPVGSCTENVEGICDNRTIISCETANGKPVFEFALAEETKIELIDSCVKVSGNGFGLTQAVDRILYRWHRVMR